MMLIKRIKDAPPTTLIRVGKTSWSFSTEHDIFSVGEEDIYTILHRGSFTLFRESDEITPYALTVSRSGPQLK